MLGIRFGDEEVAQPYLSVWPPLSIMRVDVGAVALRDAGVSVFGFRFTVRFRFFSGLLAGEEETSTGFGTSGGFGGSMGF